MTSVIGSVCITRQASGDEVFRRVHPARARASGCSAATSRQHAKKVCQFEPAVTRLLRLRCPAARAQAGAFRPERPCSLGVVKRAVPLLQNETQNMNTTEDLTSNGCIHSSLIFAQCLIAIAPTAGAPSPHRFYRRTPEHKVHPARSSAKLAMFLGCSNKARYSATFPFW